MNIAFVLFDGVTFLDFAGFYDVVIRLRHFEPYSELKWDVCAASDSVKDDQGLEIRPGRVLPDLSGYDLVFVPGGWGTRSLRHDQDFISWLKGAGEAKWIISVCTGSLLLGAAGLLEGKKTTTHPNAAELLEPYCREVSNARIVHDGRVMTGGGVSTSIDLGLYVVGLLAGDEAARTVKKQIDYPYELHGVDIVLSGGEQ